MGGGDFEMVERVSFQYLLTSDNFYDDNIFYRQISLMKLEQKTNDQITVM